MRSHAHRDRGRGHARRHPSDARAGRAPDRRGALRALLRAARLRRRRGAAAAPSSSRWAPTCAASCPRAPPRCTRADLRSCAAMRAWGEQSLASQFRVLPEAAAGMDRLLAAGTILAGASAAELHGIPFRFVAYTPGAAALRRPLARVLSAPDAEPARQPRALGSARGALHGARAPRPESRAPRARARAGARRRAPRALAAPRARGRPPARAAARRLPGRRRADPVSAPARLASRCPRSSSASSTPGPRPSSSASAACPIPIPRRRPQRCSPRSMRSAAAR